ncbi:MAG: histidine kinase, partial [Flavobacteriales bacterium]|nr:histidine kinase [Flavobacteriales bacterium]
MIKYLSSILLVCFSLFSLGQEEGLYRNYTVEDGLPSSEVYFSFQDSEGYMWFATDGGVCRFNGYEFEVFNTTNGLTDNTVFRITEDAKGRIWFAPFNGQFCYYHKGKIHQYIHNDKLKNIKGMARLTSFYVDKVDNIWLGALYSGIQKIDANGNIEEQIIPQVDRGIINKQIKIEEEYITGSLLVVNNNKTYLEGDYSIFSELNNVKDSKVQKLTNLGGNRGVFKVASHKNNMVYLERDNLFWVNQSTMFNQQIKQLARNKGIFLGVENSVVYVGYENEGVAEYRLQGNRLVEKRRFLDGLSVSSIYKDNQGGMWFSTLSNGVYYLPSQAISKKKPFTSSVFDVEVDTLRGVVYTALRNGELYAISDSVYFIEHLFKNSLNISYNYEKKSLFWLNFIGTEVLFFYDQEQQELNLVSESSNDFKAMLFKKDTIYLVNHVGFKVFYKNGECIYSSYIEKNKKIWCTSLLMNGDSIWIGSNKGMLIYNKKTQTTRTLESPLLSSISVTCMEQLNDSVFLIGTKSKGVLVIKNGMFKQVFNTNTGLSSNLVRTIHVDNQQTIWVGSTKGITKLRLKANDQFEVFNLSKKHGLISEEITDIESIKDTLYVGTAKGLLTINRNELQKNNFPPLIYLKTVLVNAKAKLKDSLALLTHTENNISIVYEGLNYRSQGAVSYRYRLLGEGLDSNWVTTKARIARYSLLPSGTYGFEVKAENEDGIWSQPQQISFTIHPPFWKTWWFIVLMFLFFGSIVFLIVYNYFKNREKQLQIEKQLVELELKALRSQMNPHFIFNILNSIQHY